MGLTKAYIARRLLVFLAVVLVAATVNFIVPRLAPGDPVDAMLQRMMSQGAQFEGRAELVKEYRKMFGLDDSLPLQYIKYLKNTARLDLGYSLSTFPAKVMYLIRRSLPWTIGLLSVSTIIAFGVGITMGALMGWRGTPRMVRNLLPLMMTFAAIPYYLMAILLLYVFAFGLNLFPASGAYSTGTTSGFNLSFIADVLYHATLPALSIVLVGVGSWALGMRGMMVTIAGEDYLTLAKAKGLKRARIFWRYGVRNAMLPQVTALAIALGHVVSGAVLVEIMFAYPGIGYLLYQGISNADYTLIQGITFFLVLSVAAAILVLDLLYPRLDPRITYGRR